MFLGFHKVLHGRIYKNECTWYEEGGKCRLEVKKKLF